MAFPFRPSSVGWGLADHRSSHSRVFAPLPLSLSFLPPTAACTQRNAMLRVGHPPHTLVRLPLLSLLLSFFKFPPSVSAAVSTTTVDDTSSQWTFTGEWTAVSPEKPCDGCASKPDISQVEGGTFHDGNYMRGSAEKTGGSLSFSGSAVSIYGIAQDTSMPDIVFTLDSSPSSTFWYAGSERFLYRTLFFAASGLTNGPHTVSWVFNTHAGSPRDLQAALFDYAVVTAGTADPAPGPGPGPAPAPQGVGSTGESKLPSSGTGATTSVPLTGSGPHSLSSSPPSTHSTPAGSAAGAIVSSGATTNTVSNSNSPSTNSGASGAPAAAPPKSASHIAAILGAVFGTLGAAIIVGLALCLHRRRGRQRRRHSLLVARPVTDYKPDGPMGVEEAIEMSGGGSRGRVRRTLLVHPFVETDVETGVSAEQLSKAREAGYGASPTGTATASTARLLPGLHTQTETHPSPLSPDTPSTGTPTSAVTARERLLEARLAQLEATLAGAAAAAVHRGFGGRGGPVTRTFTYLC
ncbi:Myb-DNA-bind-2 domain-containing protein [Mycena indigotica]|uniref:Myb-DNA-bind-2 domain-containing protein n=1 Tax=Mycena indigotica TaxID=2126181 RepID=A0A8H6S0C5_9AGAR|nr:Myb-DNA-bind-2 domain-containing protein [Mycena indigotica]KAF7288955.1 Myb-DNA-bind-2 domain-containing protein [Mycena indigotica]